MEPAAPGPIETDALVIGAGPTGLFQVFELGLLGIRAHVVDSLPQPGGQCIELYPDKPIYDIPALKVCTGRELVDRLLAQVEPFAPTLHLGQEVNELQAEPDGRFRVATTAGTRFLARSVFIAGGVGSFQAKRLRAPGLDDFEGGDVQYRPLDGAAVAGLHVVVVGGDEAAVDAALALADAGEPAPAHITLLHRRDVFKADAARLARLANARASGRVGFVAGQVIGGKGDGGRLASVQVALSEGGERTLPADRLLVFLGLSPKLGPIADWGLAMERKQLAVDPARFETSVPGIHAVGDVNTYPGKKKLILCGFHEATLAAFAAASRLYPERDGPLEYTTSSLALQRALGVAPAGAA